MCALAFVRDRNHTELRFHDTAYLHTVNVKIKVSNMRQIVGISRVTELKTLSFIENEPNVTLDGPHFAWQALTPPHIEIVSSNAAKRTIVPIRTAVSEFLQLPGIELKILF